MKRAWITVGVFAAVAGMTALYAAGSDEKQAVQDKSLVIYTNSGS
jgi:hypothetical protein